MKEPEYTLVSQGPIRAYRVSIGRFEFLTPALALPRPGGRRVVYAERVVVATRGRGAVRRLASRLRGAKAPVVEVVLDTSLGFDAEIVAELGRVAASECPEASYCLPPVLVGGPPRLYERLLRSYWEAGGVGASLPLSFPEEWWRVLDAWDGRGFVVCDAARRGWASVAGEAAKLREAIDAPIYVLNYYRGGPVPRPAHELLFFRYGFDILGYTRPPLRQLRALLASVRESRRVGLDPEKPVYVEGGAPFEEVAEALLEKLLEEIEGGAPAARPEATGVTLAR